MTKQLILFNGPPRSGKDTAADHVWAHNPNTFRFKISAPIKAAIRGMFDLTDAEVAYLEANKDKPDPLLFNRSYREAQISFSEQWAKEIFGVHVFGKLAARKVQRSSSTLMVCSDSGFDYEAEPLLRYVGDANTLLIRIHRPGTDFTNDSRNYIRFGRKDVTELDMWNSGSVQDFQKHLDQVIAAWLSR